MTDYAGTLHSFLTALKAAGLRIPAGTSAEVVTAATAAGPLNPGRVRAATRALTCTSPADIAIHDREFARFFFPHAPRTPKSVEKPEPTPGGTHTAAGVRIGSASEAEVLKHADLALSAQAEQALKLLDRLSVRPPRTRSMRKHTAAKGQIDLAQALRHSVRSGELMSLPARRTAIRTRPLTVVLDVSNSMRIWLPALVRFGRLCALSAQASCYAAGTRLTTLTGALASEHTDLDADVLLRLAPDAAGGTQLGNALLQLLAEHRNTVRSSVVVIVSDGWESGDGHELSLALSRMSRLAARTLWVNPRAGREGFSAQVTGLRIAGEAVDAMLPATTVAQWEAVAQAIAGQRVAGQRAADQHIAEQRVVEGQVARMTDRSTG